MRRIISARPSPAIVVAVVALVAALAGTAIAGPGASTSALTKAKVKSIATKKANQAIQNTLPIGSTEFGTINTRTATATINSFSFGEATANCQTGEKVISGGSRGPGTFPLIAESHKQGEGWRVRAFNNTGNNNETLTVEAYCLQP
jgi:hypothetical protein